MKNFDIIAKAEEGFNCSYYKLHFEDEKSCSKCVEQAVESGSNILLFLPCIESVSLLYYYLLL